MSGLCKFPNRTSLALRRSKVPSEFLLTLRTSLDGNVLAFLGTSTMSHVPASRRDSGSSAIAISHRSRLGELRADFSDGESDSDISRM